MERTTTNSEEAMERTTTNSHEAMECTTTLRKLRNALPQTVRKLWNALPQSGSYGMHYHKQPGSYGTLYHKHWGSYECTTTIRQSPADVRKLTCFLSDLLWLTVLLMAFLCLCLDYHDFFCLFSCGFFLFLFSFFFFFTALSIQINETMCNKNGHHYHYHCCCSTPIHYVTRIHCVTVKHNFAPLWNTTSFREEAAKLHCTTQLQC